jgi:hypothetical protein
MKKIFFLGLVMSFFFGMHSVHATEIANIKALYTTDNKIFLEWDHLSDSLLFDTDGYAFQFSQYENKVRNVDSANLYLGKGQNNITLRGAKFEQNIWYYFRAYTYVREGRSRTLTNGSKILKWKYLSSGDTESELLETNDPVISDDNEISGIDFGKLRVVRYDTYATFSWSRPNLAKNDATGIVIVIKESGNSDTLVELESGLDITSGKVTGLIPETAYEAKGYFYKRVGGDDQKFGTGITETFTTQKAFSSAQKARIERLRQRGLMRDMALTTVAVPGSVTTITTSTDTTTSSTSTNTTTSKTSSTSKTHTRTEILKKIADLERDLQTWRLKLKRLGTSSNSQFNRTTNTQTRYPNYGTSSKRTTTTRSSSKETVRERMCRVLKRNCK